MLWFVILLIVPLYSQIHTEECTVTSVKGCYTDGGDGHRVLNYTAQGDPNFPSMTREYCASLCYTAGPYQWNGVEFGTQCYCGNGFDPHNPTHSVPLSECDKHCSGASNETCGAADRIWVFTATCKEGPTPPPNSYTCLPGTKAYPLPFCNHTLTIADRVKDILNRMPLAVKVTQVADIMKPYEEIGWPGYSWNTEDLHGLGAACLTLSGVTRCPTVFPAPPGLGASFNRTVGHSLGHVISEELRAYSNKRWHRVHGHWPIGVSAWGPNLNIYRDPRWGRNVEVPSEDPYHSGEYGTAVTRGIQWGSDPKYIKVIGALKHYTAYSVETGRFVDNFAISAHDMENTYLPQFESAIRQADAKGYMCSYSTVNGVPSCANKFLSQTKARDAWGFTGYVMSDCGAVNNMVNDKVHYAKSHPDAAAKALTDGLMNHNCGGGLTNYLGIALAEGLCKESDLDARLTRSFTLLMQAGIFDPLHKQPYTKIPFNVINSPNHLHASLVAARQSFVLLRNTNRVLPLKEGVHLALIGPHAESQGGLCGNYYEDIGVGTCAGPGCITTMAKALHNINKGGHVTVNTGCSNIKCQTTTGFDAAVQAAKEADIAVLVIGLDSTVEGEGSDRMDIRLPGEQQTLVDRVLAIGKPTVIVLFGGGLVAIDSIKANPQAHAIVQAFYPGNTGGQSVAETLFGQQNRWGKLPFTYYGYQFTKETNFMDMNMTDPPGRSYKYYTGKNALWPFGYGLSYTTFTIQHDITLPTTLYIMSPGTTVSYKVTNTGNITGDEVVFLFHTKEWDNYVGNDPLAIRELVGFERVTLAPGASQTVTFNITSRGFSTVNHRGDRRVLPGIHTFTASRGHGEVLRSQCMVALTQPIVLSEGMP